ncbi:hypothetical protein SARC_14589, partial [Sphaeroforma arctica JP610]
LNGDHTVAVVNVDIHDDSDDDDETTSGEYTSRNETIDNLEPLNSGKSEDGMIPVSISQKAKLGQSCFFGEGLKSAPILRVKWDNICRTIQVKVPGKRKLEEKVILSGVCGVARPGEMLAIMGPSG